MQFTLALTFFGIDLSRSCHEGWLEEIEVIAVFKVSLKTNSSGNGAEIKIHIKKSSPS